MRETTCRIGASSAAAWRVSVLVLSAGILAATAVADTSETTVCPTNLDCSSRMAKLLAKGIDESHSLRTLVETIGAHPGIQLELEFRRQRPGKHAQSFLTVRGVYASDQGEVHRRVTGVTGEVVIPWVAYAHEQIARLAHELQHVRLLLDEKRPSSDPEEEQAVILFEEIVRGELGSRRP